LTNQQEFDMSYLFALLQKFASLLESPHLPMDSDYSYQARQQEVERIRKSRGTIMGIRL